MSETQYISRGEHDEFIKRMSAEHDGIREANKRQDARIAKLEDSVEKMTALTISVEKMAVSMEQMAKELKSQGERLEQIESKPAKRWDLIISGLLGAIAAAIGGGVVAALVGAMH